MEGILVGWLGSLGFPEVLCGIACLAWAPRNEWPGQRGDRLLRFLLRFLRGSFCFPLLSLPEASGLSVKSFLEWSLLAGLSYVEQGASG